MAYPVLKIELDQIFNQSPKAVTYKVVDKEHLDVIRVLRNISAKAIRDAKLLSTSSDNMHHI